MALDNATEYADSLAASIARDGLGVIDIDTEQWYCNAEDAEAQGVEDYTEASGYDYLSDVLDIEYIVSADKTYKAARILVAFGGPNAWINTQTHQLEVSWWSEPVYRELPREFCEALDDFLAELYNI